MIYTLQHMLWDDVIGEGGTGGIYSLHRRGENAHKILDRETKMKMLLTRIQHGWGDN